MAWVYEFLVLFVVVCLVLAAMCLARGNLANPMGAQQQGLSDALGHTVGGGRSPPGRTRLASRRAPPAHLVVDTLNLTHWINPAGPSNPLTPDRIIEAIDATAPVLKQQYRDKVIYVLKDRDSRFDDAEVREKYGLAAQRNGVYVSVASKYREPPAGTKPSTEHSSLGRDDFYMALLAARNHCAVLTADKLRDFSRFRATIPPFYVVEYAYWRDAPEYEFVRPESTAYARLRRPPTVHPSEYFALPKPNP